MAATDPATVLIVDDERDVADAYAAQLSSRYDVETAYSGAEALSVLTPAVDVVLLDRRMPQVDGRDVLSAIRDRELDARIAMVTAVDPGFDIIDMPFDDYVVKPATRSDLVETVERLVTVAAYETRIRDYYALSSEYAALRASKTDAELADNEEFQELAARLDSHRAELDRIATSFDDDDYAVVFRNFAPPDGTRAGVE